MANEDIAFDTNILRVIVFPTHRAKTKVIWVTKRAGTGTTREDAVTTSHVERKRYIARYSLPKFKEGDSHPGVFALPLFSVGTIPFCTYRL